MFGVSARNSVFRCDVGVQVEGRHGTWCNIGLRGRRVHVHIVAVHIEGLIGTSSTFEIHLDDLKRYLASWYLVLGGSSCSRTCIVEELGLAKRYLTVVVLDAFEGRSCHGTWQNPRRRCLTVRVRFLVSHPC